MRGSIYRYIRESAYRRHSSIFGRDDALRGVLNVNKPSGMTSRAVVNRVASVVGRTKVGHAGTLDPLASGVLIVCVGSTTRLIEWIQRLPKGYRTVIQLGATSDTLDADGDVVAKENPQIPSEVQVRAAIEAQVGEIVQVPPSYSALKVEGQRAYELARAGQMVELAPRTVRIDKIEPVRYQWPWLELQVECGGGTYIRSIARDIGDALGCGGLVEKLVRTRIGSFRLEESHELEDLTPASLMDQLLPPLEAVGELPRIVLNTAQVAAVIQGRPLGGDSLPLDQLPRGEVALLDHNGGLVGIAHVHPGQRVLLPRKVLS
jgi:tRNA pseudouridine55 synthase